jgi:hypothetical protein
MESRPLPSRFSDEAPWNTCSFPNNDNGQDTYGILSHKNALFCTVTGIAALTMGQAQIFFNEIKALAVQIHRLFKIFSLKMKQLEGILKVGTHRMFFGAAPQPPRHGRAAARVVEAIGE